MGSRNKKQMYSKNRLLNKFKKTKKAFRTFRFYILPEEVVIWF